MGCVLGLGGLNEWRDGLSDLRHAPVLIRRLYQVAFVDGLALLCLVLIAVPLKRVYDMPWGVKILGPIHGALFITLVFLLVSAVGKRLLKKRLAVLIFVLAFVPLGAFVADYVLKKSLGEPSPL